MPALVTAMPTKPHKVNAIGIMNSWIYWLLNFGQYLANIVFGRGVLTLAHVLHISTYSISICQLHQKKLKPHREIRDIDRQRGVRSKCTIQSAEPRPGQVAAR